MCSSDLRCDVNNPLDGSTDLCGVCVVDLQCAGYTGRPDGTTCYVEAGSNGLGTCLKRCTQGQAECPDGYTCDAHQMCSPDVPCPTPAPRCMYAVEDQGAVQLVKRGKALTDEYTRAMRAYYEDDGSDPAREDALAREYFRLQYEVGNQLDLIETLRSTFKLFGGVF